MTTTQGMTGLTPQQISKIEDWILSANSKLRTSAQAATARQHFIVQFRALNTEIALEKGCADLLAAVREAQEVISSVTFKGLDGTKSGAQTPEPGATDLLIAVQDIHAELVLTREAREEKERMVQLASPSWNRSPDPQG